MKPGNAPGPAVVGFCGVKNSGKTTLIEKVVPMLKLMGYRVGIIKHDAHDFVPDVPGTDSYRLAAAGAESIAVYSESRCMVVRKQRDTTVEQLIPRLGDVDIVLMEGGKRLDYPKIELVRQGNSHRPVCGAGELIALCTNTGCRLPGLPTLPLDDAVAVALFVAARAGTPRPRTGPLFGTAVILAGGQSSRMGFDKQLLCVGGRTLTQLLAGRLRRLFGEVLVVSNNPAACAGLELEVIPDLLSGMGPPSGLHAGLLAARSRYVYFTACDMPNLSFAYIDYLEEQVRRTGCDVCLTRNGRWFEPFHAFYSRSILPRLAGNLLQGNSSVVRLLHSLDTCYVPEVVARRYTPDWRLFHNLNTRGQYSAYLHAHRSAI